MPRTLVGQAVYGNAATLNGSSQYFKRSIISTVSDNLTITAWINFNSVTGSHQAIFQNGSNNSDGYIFFVKSDGKLYLDLSFVSNLTSATTLTAGVDYFVALQRSGGTWQMYLNAVADGGTITNSPNSPSVNTTIGAHANSSGVVSSGYFGGKIDDVRFYSRVLSTTELTDIMNKATNPDIIVDSTSLQGHYKFDETSGDGADSSGNGRTITNFGTSTYTTGVVTISNVPARTVAGNRFRLRDMGTCLDFDGVNDNVSIGNAALGTAMSAAYTMSVWLKRGRLSTKEDIFRGNNSDSLHFNFNANNTLRIYHAGTTPNATTTSATYYDYGWHMYTATYNGSTIKIYRDATEIATQGVTGSLGLDGTLTLNSAVGDFFKGLMDEARIWNVALTPTEITELYYRNTVRSTNLQRSYVLDEGSGTTATDTSSNAVDGTIAGAVYSTGVFIKPRTVASI